MQFCWIVVIDSNKGIFSKSFGGRENGRFVFVRDKEI